MGAQGSITVKLILDTTEFDAALARVKEELGDGWVNGHDLASKAMRKALADQVRNHCTPSSEAYSKGGDTLIAAVADWIENPPEWVSPVRGIL